MPILCPSCGQLIIDTSLPCSSCGAVVSASGTLPQNFKKVETVRMYENASYKTSKESLAARNIPLTVDICNVVGMLFLVLSLVGAFLLFNNYGFVIAATSFLLSLISILIIFGIGDIVNQLAIANYYADVMKQQNEKVISLLSGNKQA